jgi:hypothetical protein
MVTQHTDTKPPLKNPSSKRSKKLEMNDDRLWLPLNNSTIDPESFYEDDRHLAKEGWELFQNREKFAEWVKAKQVLKLKASVAAASPHRINWELTIFSRVQGSDTEVQVGYACAVLRPGDLFQGNRLDVLIKEAVAAGEAEHARWSDALAEARRSIGKTLE